MMSLMRKKKAGIRTFSDKKFGSHFNTQNTRTCLAKPDQAVFVCGLQLHYGKNFNHIFNFKIANLYYLLLDNSDLVEEITLY